MIKKANLAFLNLSIVFSVSLAYISRGAKYDFSLLVMAKSGLKVPKMNETKVGFYIDRIIFHTQFLASIYPFFIRKALQGSTIQMPV